MFFRSFGAPLGAAGLSLILVLPTNAQQAPPPVQLPALVVQQSAAPKKKAVAKAKPKVTAVTPATPTPPPTPVATTQPPVAAGSNSLVNAGTPSASVAPVNGGSPAGQTATSIDMGRFKSTPVFSVSDILREAPGVSLKQGNGPRDFGISIRGSNARNGFAIRNIVILEDGFPVTQPDGLSRSDLIDPHAYGGVDVWRGPSSALFGNYATGGAINFRTRRGREIDGVEYGVDIGSFGYVSNYVAGGTKTETFEGSIFLSDVRGDGHYDYSAFDTQTANILLTYLPTAKDKITFKFINNELDTELPFRMSLNQFNINAFQQGCRRAVGAAAGCATNNFSATNTNPRVTQTAEQEGANRDDRRTIGGLRWEHAFDAETTGRVQVVIDDRNINQPTGTTSAIGDFLSTNVISDLTNKTNIGGLPATFTIGGFWNHLPVDSFTYNVAPGGGAPLGKLQSRTKGATTNFGLRLREELAAAETVNVVAGVTVERTILEGQQRSFTYNAQGATLTDRTVTTDREITNAAPELGVVWRPTDVWQFRARVGAGYGTPQFTNLFVTPQGTPGNNTDLETQKNVGYDLGVEWTPARGVMLSVTGFYEFFENEIVSQSAGPGLLNYSFNAPKSEHRGVEAQADVTLLPGLRLTAAYLWNDQFYTEYQERLSGSTLLFDRAGNKIPGVSPHEITTRLGYDFEGGALKGLGAYVEYQWHDTFYMENANLLEAPGYDVVNLNVHWDADLGFGPLRSLLAYFEVRNVLDETYISAANNITDTVGATPASLANIGGTIYAGAPRSYFGGVKVRF